jgi:hypothetical protein
MKQLRITLVPFVKFVGSRMDPRVYIMYTAGAIR